MEAVPALAPAFAGSRVGTEGVNDSAESTVGIVQEFLQTTPKVLGVQVEP